MEHRYHQSDTKEALRYVKNTAYHLERGECLNLKQSPYLDIEKIAEDEKYYGYSALITGEINRPHAQAVRTYHNLWKMGRSFQLTKGGLQANPNHQDSIKAHFLTSFIALLVFRLLAKRLGGKHR